MSAMVIDFDRDLATRLRPIWLRLAAAAFAVAAHALMLVVVLWPKDIAAPAETDIEINAMPQQMAAADTGPSTSATTPDLPPSEAMPVDTATPVMPLAPEAALSKPLTEVKVTKPEEVAPDLPPPAQPLPAPAVIAQTPPPTLPVAQADDAAIPIRPNPINPAPVDPVPVKPQDDAVRKELVEQRHRALTDQKKVAEREAAEKAKQAADLAKRQAQARENVARAATVSRPASLPPAPALAGVSATAPSPISAAAIGAYRGQVIGHLSAYKHYPDSARARGAEGHPSVAFVLDASGRVVSVTLTHASGQPDIDAEVVAMVRRASPFPPPPAGAGRLFSATIGFVLR